MTGTLLSVNSVEAEAPSVRFRPSVSGSQCGFAGATLLLLVPQQAGGGALHVPVAKGGVEPALVPVESGSPSSAACARQAEHRLRCFQSPAHGPEHRMDASPFLAAFLWER